MGKKKKKKKPEKTWLYDLTAIVSILTGLSNIAFMIYQVIKG